MRAPAGLSLRGHILLRSPIASDASGLCCCRSARRCCPSARRCRRARCRGLARQIAARAGLGSLRSSLSAGTAAGDLRLLLRWSRRGPRRRRVPRHSRGGRTTRGTGKPLRRRAGRLGSRTRRGSLLRRVTRRGDLRCGPWRGYVWSGRGVRSGRRVRCRRRTRSGRRVRRGSRGSGARGRRSSRFPSLFLRLRGCGCRNRSRNDKKCRDADVPLQHDTASYVARTSQPARWYAGSACASTAAYTQLTSGAATGCAF